MKNKKNYLITVLLLVVAILLFFKMPESKNGDEELAYELDNSIFFIKSDGSGQKEILKEETRGNPDNDYVKGSYRFAQLSPDGKKVVCYKQVIGENNKSEIYKFQLLLVDLDTLTINSIFENPIEDPVFAALEWSANGKEINFIRGNKLFVFNIERHKVEKIIELVDVSPENGSSKWDCYIRRSKTKPGVYFILAPKIKTLSDSSDTQKIILEVDVTTGLCKTLWKGIAGLTNEHPGDGSQFSVISKQIEKEPFESLFGSIEFPVLAPNFTADGKYYYYKGLRAGFFAKSWLGIYNHGSNKKWDVKVFWRALYTDG